MGHQDLQAGAHEQEHEEQIDIVRDPYPKGEIGYSQHNVRVSRFVIGRDI